VSAPALDRGPMKLSADQLQTLRHMLGIDDPHMRIPKPHRDYFCADPSDGKMLALVSAGAVEKYAEQGGYHWFQTTDAGREAAMKSHKSIRLPKSRRVYSKFLDIRDCFPDLTFQEFLTNPEFSETRRSA